MVDEQEVADALEEGEEEFVDEVEDETTETVVPTAQQVYPKERTKATKKTFHCIQMRNTKGRWTLMRLRLQGQ